MGCSASGAGRVREVTGAQHTRETTDAKHVRQSCWVQYGGESLEPLLEHTSLVDAEFLVDLADKGGIVPRWQELPEVAKIGPANVWQLRCCAFHYFLPVVVLSYPWLDRSHPDRLGSTLQRIAPILRRMLKDVKQRSRDATIGVLWDFMSLPQFPRSDDFEKQRFKAGLCAINQWYAHPYTHVLLATYPVPVDDGKYENTRPYENRGWCKFERTISGLTKYSTCTEELGMEVRTIAMEGQSIAMPAKPHRGPPISPDVFSDQVRIGVREGTIAFTAGADEDFVIEQYRKGFVHAYENHTRIQFNGGWVHMSSLDWGDEEAFVMAKAIEYAVEHCSPPEEIKINIKGNRFSEAGIKALQEAQGGQFSFVF
ncbi:unnamed protein product [Prorocentrum cordatum]|uniref:Uncharacterized protein n=1 Tax=Prorocentrum cordatum TaxID=2364126 RepID=A0ABN9PSA8_9DINO|nr:unnamed protein product [Polarella glacialis]